MSILDCLDSIVSDKTENIGHKEGITDGVFECAIYRLGLDPKEWMADPVVFCLLCHATYSLV